QSCRGSRNAVPARMASRSVIGNGDQPQFPATSVVTPWDSCVRAAGCGRRLKSAWECRSMNPGATMLPVASMTSAPEGTSPGGSTAMIRPPSTSTVAATGSAPVPSITCPPVSAMVIEPLLSGSEGEGGDAVRRDQPGVDPMSQTSCLGHLYDAPDGDDGGFDDVPGVVLLRGGHIRW